MSYFRTAIDALEGYTPGEQPQAGKFIKLNTNENPYPCSPAVPRAIRATLENGLQRYPDAMATAFRRRAAELLGVEPDWILCGNGSDDILTMATRAFVGEGQLLRLPYPSYILYRTLAEIQGASWQEVRFEPDWTLPDEFAAADTDLRLAMLPNPNSPSGTLIPKDDVLELAERLPCPLLVDEAYVEFADESCVDLVPQSENILVSRSLSKSYALAGLRFGYVVARPEIIAGLVKVKDSYNCDALSISGATAAIDDQAWLAETREKVIATRERMTRELEALNFSVIPSQANFVWCTNPSGAEQSIYEQLKHQRILVRYMNYPQWGDGLRISVGTDPQIDALLALLKEMV